LRSQNVQIPAGTVKNAASEAGFRVLGQGPKLSRNSARWSLREAEGGLVRRA
jgi:HAE1 family hydrophobic/amphiphilic exporter-1